MDFLSPAGFLNLASPQPNPLGLPAATARSEALPVGGDGNATRFTTDGCSGLLIMGSPSQGHIPSVMDKSLWKYFLAVGPSIKLHDVTESKLIHNSIKLVEIPKF
jgi:hypothetical protein